MGRGRSDSTLALVRASYEILQEIQPASVRAVCYRLFTMGLLNNMSKNETNKVSRLLTQAREQGEIPWAWLVDETREVEQAASWNDPETFMAVAQRSYRKDHWSLQPRHVEVWSEKGTIRGTVQPVLDEFGLPFRVMHGYGSATAVRNIAQAAEGSDKPWTVFYIGDFDPSGLHMSAVDLPGRLQEYGSAKIKIIRLALTKQDVLRGRLPSFSLASKAGDTRAIWYAKEIVDMGNGTWMKCWEVDALSPVILRKRLHVAITKQLDQGQWDRSVVAEQAEQSAIKTYIEGYNSISRPASQYEDHG